MSNGKLEDLKFGFREERYFPSTEKWVQCIHWRISHHHVGRLLTPNSYSTFGRVLLTVHRAPTPEEYRKDPRVATYHSAAIEKWGFDELDPLAVVSIVEEWSKKEPFKVVEAPEAAMLPFPS